VNFGQINQILAPLGTFTFPVRAVGNEDLKEVDRGSRGWATPASSTSARP
jgi:hypothetical protein